MATLRPSYLAHKRACKTETTSCLAREAAAERPPCVRVRAPSLRLARPRHAQLRPARRPHRDASRHRSTARRRRRVSPPPEAPRLPPLPPLPPQLPSRSERRLWFADDELQPVRIEVKL
jgi:hypothetical protein